MSWPAVDQLPYWFEMRRRGYEQGMREAGLTPLPTLFIPEVPQDRPITAEVFERECRKQVGFFMELSRQDPPVDAIICHTDGEAPYAAWALRRCGLEPGRDVTIAGYDHYALEMVERAWSSDLPQVTVDKQNWLMGQEMVRLLQDRVAGKLPKEPQERVVSPKLIELPT
jgi:DNA-binding LacI/PurR family transcriptional regulator